jgi:hypothetical protein
VGRWAYKGDKIKIKIGMEGKGGEGKGVAGLFLLSSPMFRRNVPDYKENSWNHPRIILL